MNAGNIWPILKFSKQYFKVRSKLVLTLVNNNSETLYFFLQRKRTKSAVVENAKNENPMKRQKVHMGAADITYQTYQTESDSSKKVFFPVALMPPNYINQKEFLQSKCANLQARRSHTDGYVGFAYSFFCY